MDVDNRLAPYFDRLVELVETEEAKRELLRRRDEILHLLADAYVDGSAAGVSTASIGLTTTVL